MPGNIDFPVRVALKECHYAPLYFEPIPESGERICIGVVVEFDKESRVVVTDEVHRLEALYGHPIPGILGLIEITAANLEHHLSTHAFTSLGEWSSGLSFFVGAIRTCHMPAADTLADAALSQCCILYRTKF